VPALEAKLPSTLAESLADKIFTNLTSGHQEPEPRAPGSFPLAPPTIRVPRFRENGFGPRP
jgi:hypothetical protein